MYDFFEKAIRDFPNQVPEAIEAAGETGAGGNFDRVVLFGMGASSAMGEFLKDYFGIPVVTPRGYKIPRLDENTLVIFSSSSGETEEVLYAFKYVMDKKMLGNCVGTGFGGYLMDLCGKHNVPFAQIEKPFDKLQPRWAYGYSFAALGCIIENSLKKDGFKNDAADAAARIKPTSMDTKADEIANFLKDKHPVFHGPEKLKGLSRLWKIEIGEDTKRPAFAHRYPEVNHFETVSFSKNGEGFAILTIQDDDDHPRILERQKESEKLLEKAGVKCMTVKLEGSSYMQKMFNSIVLSMWVGLKLCEHYQEDPSELAMVRELKDGIHHGEEIKKKLEE